MPSLAEQVERDLARRWIAAMLEQIDALPRAKDHSAALDRYGELGLGKRRPEVRGHVVRTLVGMLVGGMLRCDAREIVLEVPARGRSGVFLDEQGCRGVPA